MCKFSSIVSVVTPFPKAGHLVLLLTIKSKRFNTCWPESSLIWRLAAQLQFRCNSLVITAKHREAGMQELPYDGSLSGFSPGQDEFAPGGLATTALQTGLCKWEVCCRCDVASFFSSRRQHCLLCYLVPTEGGSTKFVSTKDFCLVARNEFLRLKFTS